MSLDMPPTASLNMSQFMSSTMPPRTPPRTSFPLVQILLPTALLLSSYLSPSLLTLPYLLTFLHQLRALPTTHFPYTPLVLLLLYSLLNLALHVSLTITFSQTSQASLPSPATLVSLGLPRYFLSAWAGVRTLLPHLIILFSAIISYLTRHPATRARYIIRAFRLVRLYLSARARRRAARKKKPSLHPPAYSLPTPTAAASDNDHDLDDNDHGDENKNNVDHASTPQLHHHQQNRRAVPWWQPWRRVAAWKRRDVLSARAPHPARASWEEELREGDRAKQGSGGPAAAAAAPAAGWMTLERIEAVLGDDADEEDDEIAVRRLTAHEFDTHTPPLLQPLPHPRPARGAPRHGHVDGEADGGVDVDMDVDVDAVAVADEDDDGDGHGNGGAARAVADVEAQEEGVAVVPPPSKLTMFMAGRGGVLWCTLSAALLGTSYSSVLTFFVLLPTLVVIVASASSSRRSAPRRRPALALRVLAVMRVYLLAYLVAVYVFQFRWLDAIRETSVAKLIGLVVLDTNVDFGWAHVMAVGAAVVCYVFVGMHAKAVATVARFDAVAGTVFDDDDGEADARHSSRLSSEAAEVAEENNQSRKTADDVSINDDSAAMLSVASSSSPFTQRDAAAGLPRAKAANALRVSYNMELFLTAMVHLSTLGMLIWALVFPGLLSVPLLFAAFANLRWPKSNFCGVVVDKLVWYAVALEMVQFAFAAVTNAFENSRESIPIVRVLGLRTFDPQFAMNLVQTGAIVLLCIKVRAERRLKILKAQASHDADLRLPNGDPLDSTQAYFADLLVKRNTLDPLFKVFIDQVALAAVYVAGGYEASVLNALFLIALVIICLFQATRSIQHPKLLSWIWTVILVYASAFLFANGAVCRASRDQFVCDDLNDWIGLKIASTPQTVAYATTVVMAAVQVHFTWPSIKDNRDSEHLPMFRSKFWVLLRENFIYFAYGALLLYPLVYPANYLSYCYMVLLSLCILVEILATNVNMRNLQVQGARNIIRASWFVVVLFSSIALLARYFARFDQFQNSPSTRLWVFGLERGVRDFQITLGDAIVLIMMSLQGRMFIISELLEEREATGGISAVSTAPDTLERAGRTGERSGGSSEQSSRHNFAAPPFDATDGDVGRGEQALRPGASGDGIFDRQKAAELGLRLPGSSKPLSSGSVGDAVEPMSAPEDCNLNADADDVLGAGLPAERENKRGIRFADESQEADGGVDKARIPPLSRTHSLRRSFRSSLYDLVEVSNGAKDGDVHHAEAMKVLRNLRKSMPVKQTERFLSSSLEYFTIFARSLLLQYNYVFEAIAILVAAVWLDGVTVFGGIYLAIGCVLMISEHFVRETMEERRARWTTSLRNSDNIADGGDVGESEALNNSSGVDHRTATHNRSGSGSYRSGDGSISSVDALVRNGASAVGSVAAGASSVFNASKFTDLFWRITSSWSAKYLPPVLVILSFALMSLQYLYLILSTSGVVDESRPWGQKALYLGLQAVPKVEEMNMLVADKELLPIGLRAMLAHVLVFVMAFLQRVAVRWITMDERKAREEEQNHVDHMAAPLTADVYTSAVSVSEVMSGVGGPRSKNGTEATLNAEDIAARRNGEEISGSAAGGTDEPGDIEPVVPGGRAGARVAEEATAPVGSELGTELRSDADIGVRGRSSSPTALGVTGRDFSDTRVKGQRLEIAAVSEDFPGLIGRGRDDPLAHFQSKFGTEHDTRTGGESSAAGHEKVGTSLSTGSHGDANADLSGVEFDGVAKVEATTVMQKVRHAVLFVFRTLGKRTAEILALLTPFWQNWGFDFTFIFLVIGGAVTETFFSVVYVVFVLALSRLEKRSLDIRWRRVTLALVGLVALQYLLTLGLPPTGSGDPDAEIRYLFGMSDEWARWFYLDSLTRAMKFREALVARKFSITFAFLAVICAGVTFNALDEQRKLRKRRNEGRGSGDLQAVDDHGSEKSFTDADRSVSRDPHAALEQLARPEMDARVRIVRYQRDGIAVHQPSGASEPVSQFKRYFSGLGRSFSGVNALRVGNQVSEVGDANHELGSRAGSVDLISPAVKDLGGFESREVEEKVDFTSRPLSFRNWVKLTWMRFAGSLVQLVMFAVATLDTNIFNAVLLGMAFYFFFQFTNTETKQTRFVFVRTYVLVVILALVIYQAPFAPRESGWARIIGLYKVDGDPDPKNNYPLLYYMLALWLLCQMQGRIYESPNFEFVVNSTRQDEQVRHRRAVHEHHDRLYEKMLGRNKNKRSHAARQARVKALEVLAERNEQPPTEVFYRVCVTNWIAYLKKRASSPEVAEQKASEQQEQQEKDALTRGMGRLERAVRYLCRGRKWVKHARRPVSRELRLFITRYSSWPVYFTMTLAAVVAPSILTLVYPLVLYLYLILEQPRPPRQAWMALLLYVYCVIIVKYIGRKPEFNSCGSSSVPFVSSKDGEEPGFTNFNYCAIASGVFFDVLVLLCLMWHRAQLYYRGLWDLPRSEEELRNYKKIQGEVVTETPDDMLFDGFDENDVPPGYSFGTGPSGMSPSSGGVGSGSSEAGERQYSFLSMKNQCELASDVLCRASEELSKLAVATGEDSPDADALVGPQDSEKKEPATSPMGSLFAGREPVHEKISKRRAAVSGGGGPSSLRSSGDLFDAVTSKRKEQGHGHGTGTRRHVSEFFGSPPPGRAASESPLHSPRAPSGRQEESEDAVAEISSLVVHRGDMYEPSNADLRHRRAAPPVYPQGDVSTTPRGRQHERPLSTFESVGSLQRSTSGMRFTEGSLGPTSRFANLLSSRRRSGTLRSDMGDEDDEEEYHGIGADFLNDGRSIVIKSLAAARLTANTAPQMRPESGGKVAEPVPDQKLSAVRQEGEGDGFFAPIRRFFGSLLDESPHKTVGDYYMAMFSIDFICFIYIMFGHAAIFDSPDSIRPWWQSNYIGRDHLFALLVMFLGIVADRIVYLRKSMAGKLIIQYVSVLGYHYWLFWYTNIGSRSVGRGFYFLKCIYFLISGLQIRTGYPLYTTGQYLLRRYNTLGIVLFTVYENIPFLWLTRTLLDWAVVPTSLELFQYLRFVDVYMWLYRNRAVNTARGLFRRKLGEMRWWFPRAYQGFGLALLCGFLLFLPFILFSFLNPFFDSRTLSETRLSIDFSSGNRTYDIYGRSTVTVKLRRDVGDEKERAKELEERYGVTVLLGDNQELFEAQFSPLSESLWLPVAADRDALAESLEFNQTVPQLRFSLTAISDSQVFRISTERLLDDATRLKIASGLKSGQSFATRIMTPLSHHLILASGSNAFEEADRNQKANRRTCLRLIYVNGSADTPQGYPAPAFWSVEDCVDKNVCDCGVVDGIGDNALFSGDEQRSVTTLLQVANVSSFQFGGGTILTVYVAILFTVASLAKRLFANKRLIVPYVDMPYTLHLYQLVLDIVYARQDGKLVMEEILYNGLIDIYRDPHEMVKWSGQRALKTDEEWWEQLSDQQVIEGYDGWPSFRETETEPYIARVVE